MARPITKDVYDKLIAFYREHPGQTEKAANACGCSYNAAKRMWDGPAKPLAPWAVPAQTLFAQEAADVQRVAAEDAARARAAADEAEERRLAKEREAKQWDENIMRLARNDVMRGLGSAAKLVDGMDKLAERVGEQLRRGVDSKGQPLDVSPLESLQILQRFSQSVRSLADAASSLVAIERVRAGLPSQVIGHVDLTEITVEDAERELRILSDSVQRAKRLGLRVLPGGKLASGA